MTKLIPCKKTTDCTYQNGHSGSCVYPKWPTVEELNQMDAQKKQIGGDHYRTKAIDPWEVVERAGLDFWEGSVVKYIMRYREKNGIEDLEKAIHNIEYLIEREKKNGA